jgi:NitT/TauT family transport system substrate-binding protein
MSPSQVDGWTRRRFLRGLTLAGTVGCLGLTPRRVTAEPPPETTTLRLLKETGRICWAPQYIAEDLLRAEGFTDVRYVDFPGGPVAEFLSAGKADLSLHFVGPNLIRLDQGDPVVFLAGVHVGCFEVIATARVRRITDLKGKAVGVSSLRGAEHVFIASIAAHVGLNPQRDITWVVNPADESIRLLSEGTIDAFLGFPPVPQELRAKQVGHVLVNSAVDRPWSQYFCCLLIGNRDFVQQHPIATKRALRAILKAADLCAQEPERAARSLRCGAPGREGDSLQPVARVRSRGHYPVLRPATAGGGDAQVKPPEAYRPGHRLALPHGIKAGTEGITAHTATRSANLRTDIKEVLARFAWHWARWRGSDAVLSCQNLLDQPEVWQRFVGEWATSSEMPIFTI